MDIAKAIVAREKTEMPDVKRLWHEKHFLMNMADGSALTVPSWRLRVSLAGRFWEKSRRFWKGTMLSAKCPSAVSDCKAAK